MPCERERSACVSRRVIHVACKVSWSRRRRIVAGQTGRLEGSKRRFCASVCVCFLGNAPNISSFDACTGLTNLSSQVEHDLALAGGLVMGAYTSRTSARSSLGPVLSLRCDHCREELCLGIHRYWHMQFCSSACMAGYQQRLAPETKIKISQLDVLLESLAAA